MRSVLLTWVLFSATGAVAGERAAPALMHGEAAEPSVSVCIDRDVGPADMQLARMFAFRIFARIGTKIEWRCSGGSEPSIMVTMGANTPEGSYPGALAYAQPFGGGIRVFYDRVQNRAPVMRAPLLGYVLAHEIVHVLQGLMRHSETGIMKAHWDDSDFGEMSSMRLAFTPYDVLLIQRGIAASGLAATPILNDRALLPRVR